MKVLVTGHEGYIGSVVVPKLLACGHEVLGLDSGLFHRPDAGLAPIPAWRADVRDISRRELSGMEGVIHLAAVSNDAMALLATSATSNINEIAAIRTAVLAKRAGVRRFLFASTCSVYGAAPSGVVDESGPARPLTEYARAKLNAEIRLLALAGDGFVPVALRCATVYGHAPMFRTDLVVNDFVSQALTSGTIRLNSAGTAWRPLIHVADLADVYLALLEAAAEDVCGRVINVGPRDGNYTISDVADMVAAAVPGTAVARPTAAPVNTRSYQVEFAALYRLLPGLRLRSLRSGISALAGRLSATPLPGNWFGADYVRLRRLRDLIGAGEVTAELRAASLAQRDP